MKTGDLVKADYYYNELAGQDRAGKLAYTLIGVVSHYGNPADPLVSVRAWMYPDGTIKKDHGITSVRPDMLQTRERMEGIDR